MNQSLQPDMFAVPVEGGELAVARWGHGPEVVVASHGVTASCMEWPRVAEQLVGDVTFYALDHRGRGGSADVGGPFGLRVHADDVAAVLDHVGADRAVVVGHSMGGFVATNVDVRHHERVKAVLLLDGGLPLPVPVPEDADVEEVLRSIIGPALDRLATTFPSVDAYLDFWAQHPAVTQPGEWSEYFRAYAEYDLRPVGDGWRSKVSAEAVKADSEATLVDEETRNAIERLQAPALLLYADRGMFNEEQGLYPKDLVDTYVERVASLEAELVPDVNHYTLVLGEAGSAVVAERLRQLVRDA